MTEQRRPSSLFRNIAEVIDDMLAAGQRPVAVMMQPHRRERLRESRLKHRHNPTTPDREYTILGLPVIASPTLKQPFQVLTDEDAAWLGLGAR
jgi:hypothetical protein